MRVASYINAFRVAVLRAYIYRNVSDTAESSMDRRHKSSMQQCGPFRVEIQAFERHLPQELLCAWRNSVQSSISIRAVTQSPEWTSFRGEKDVKLASLYDGQGTLVSVSPIQSFNYKVKTSFAHSLLFRRLLGKVRFDLYRLYGSALLFPDTEDAYEAFLNAIFLNPKIDGLYAAVPEGNPFASYLLQKAPLQSSWFLLRIEQRKGDYYWIEMPEREDDYWKKFKRKQSYNLQRELKMLRSTAKVELLRISNANDVNKFVENAKPIAMNSWQKQLAGQSVAVTDAEIIKLMLRELAQRGMMRCYLLFLNDIAIAYVSGFQHNGIFWLYETAYDPEFEYSSPGKCILQMVIKDLFNYDKPNFFSFGSSGGRYPYKSWFATHSCSEMQLALIRNTALNRARAWACGPRENSPAT
jgi:hypothetical protein